MQQKRIEEKKPTQTAAKTQLTDDEERDCLEELLKGFGFERDFIRRLLSFNRTSPISSRRPAKVKARRKQ